MAEEVEAAFDPRYNPGQEAIRAEAARGEREVFFEPLFWGLFSLGGFLTAFLLPVTILAVSFLGPLGLWPSGQVNYGSLKGMMDMSNLLQGLLVRGFFFLLIVGSFFHGAHRLKYMLVEAGARKAEDGLGVILYGLAGLGSLVALYYVLVGWLI
ncbi:MAG TPA: hypothetical protein VIB49_03435 [Thermoplasmata archaeon]|jgi:fumarate reductase subunit D